MRKDSNDHVVHTPSWIFSGVSIRTDEGWQQITDAIEMMMRALE